MVTIASVTTIHCHDLLLKGTFGDTVGYLKNVVGTARHQTKMSTENAVASTGDEVFSNPPFNGTLVPKILIEDSSNSSSHEYKDCWTQLDPFYQHKRVRRHSAISSLSTGNENPEVRVLVLFTGGTIGMKLKSDGVYIPSPHLLEDYIRQMPSLNDKQYAERYFHDQSPAPLVLPKCGPDPRRIVYTIYEFDPLLDSSNMTMDDWIHVAKIIEKFYNKVDGLVILHGTDTMAYTASALSFMLENLGKPVVLTGSQIPIFEPRSDGHNNLLGALIIAGLYSIPEVALFFDHKLFRGNRTTKVNAKDFSAFDSPNMEPLVRFGIDIQVDWRSIYRSPNIEKFMVHTILNRNVGLLRLFPSITLETVQAFLRPPLSGVVLETYGNGNAPSNRKDILFEFKRASDMGIIIVNITQCNKGSVLMSYETGKALSNAGVISGLDMTPEAALTKLSYVMGQDWSIETKRKAMESNIRGEITIASQERMEDLELISAISKSLQISTAAEIDSLKTFLFPSILCASAKAGDIEKMDLLQQHGADITAYNYDFRTPLHVAASEGQIHVVKYLLQHGANVHARDRNQRTPLMDAVVGNHHGVIALLRKAGAHVTYDVTQLGNDLCSAAAKGDLLTVQSYQLAGIDMDQPDATGRTALQVAIINQRIECACFLLELGADIHRKDQLGNSADILMEKFSCLDLLQQSNRTNGSTNDE